MLKTIVVSDIHIGMPGVQTQKLLLFLENNPCEHLIINGDLIDGLYIKFFGAWRPAYTAILEQIQSICKKNHTQLICLKGNHDIAPANVSAFETLPIQDDMIYTSQGKKYYICHGNMFDPVNKSLRFISYLSFFAGNFVYFIGRTYLVKKCYALMRSLFKREAPSFSKWVFDLAKAIVVGKKKLYKQLQTEAIKKGCDGIIIGHYHEPENRYLGNIHYLNSGEWVELCSALTEDHQGNRSIVYQE